MRLIKFVNEEIDMEVVEEMDRIIDILTTKCKPFLTEFNAFPARPIYRGTSRNMGNDIIRKVHSRNERLPKDTPKFMHNMLDAMFFKYFGWKPRSQGVFVTYDRSFASDYGWTTFFFPTGTYQYLWHPQVEDMYATLREIMDDPKSGKLYGKMPRQLKNTDINEFFASELENIVKNYQATGYGRNSTKNEAMFNTKEYYMVAFDTRKEDREFLNRLGQSL